MTTSPSAVPGMCDPEECALRFRSFLIKSFQVFLIKIQKTLNLDLRFYIEKLSNLNEKKKFSPAIFTYYDLLKEGYRSKNLHQIFDALQQFKNLSESQKYETDMRFTTIMTDAWENYCVEDLRQMPDELSHSAAIQMLPLIHWEDSLFPPKELEEALDLMQTLDLGLKKEFLAYIAHIKLYAGKVLESTTSSKFFGAIYLRLPYPSENPVLLYLRNVVHELSHLHLYAMSEEDPLVLNSANQLFASPLRSDKRPMLGIYHAAFVLARMVRILRKFQEQYPKESSVEGEIEKNKKFFLEALDVISSHGHLTSKGLSIFKSLETCAFS